jgi:hypothetical protein
MIYRVWLSDAKGFDFCYISTKNRLEVDKLLEKYSKWENVKARVVQCEQRNKGRMFVRKGRSIYPEKLRISEEAYVFSENADR